MGALEEMFLQAWIEQYGATPDESVVTRSFDANRSVTTLAVVRRADALELEHYRAREAAVQQLAAALDGDPSKPAAVADALAAVRAVVITPTASPAPVATVDQNALISKAAPK